MRIATFYLVTLGCKVNQYESYALREAWVEQQLRETTSPEEADVIVVNSCAVTANAVADVRNAISRLHRAAPKATIIVTGCAAESMPEDLKKLPGVTRVVEQSRKAILLQSQNFFAAMPTTPQKMCELSPAALADGVPSPSEGEVSQMVDLETFPAFSLSGYDRSRAVLKIQDGCSHRCTYCIVPLTRGRARSRPLDESLAEVERLLAAGFREIIISGVNLRQYGLPTYSPLPAGKNIPAAAGAEAQSAFTAQTIRPVVGAGALQSHSHDFWDFLTALEERFAKQWSGQARFRLSSLEPGQLGEKALAVLGASTMIAPHVHLSLQSGSLSVLRRMGRGHYDPAVIREFLFRLTKKWPFFGLGADILTGFPGETDGEHAQTLTLCEGLPFSYAHVFPYSKRPGTAAAALPDQVEPAVKKERAAQLRALMTVKNENFLKRQLELTCVHVALEDNESAESKNDAYCVDSSNPAQLLYGVNEFYTECLFAVRGFAGSGRTLMPGRPVRMDAGTMILAPFSGWLTGKPTQVTDAVPIAPLAAVKLY